MSRKQDRVGYAPHSLRAVTPAELAALQSGLPGRVAHIHIAEQTKEVEDCIAFCGQRPVAWLLDHAAIGKGWYLVHATQLTESERRGIVAAGAVVGLCPVTEANLGDGVFPAKAFLDEAGRFGIGTDSNVRIDAAEELRTLEYGQRLAHRARNVLAEPDGSCGMRLFRSALAAAAPEIVVGAQADFLSLEDPHGLEVGGNAIVDRWVFGREVCISDVWAAGSHVVRGGRHIAREKIQRRASKVLRRILG